jgi:serine/threonine protein phosphatase PrpC
MFNIKTFNVTAKGPRPANEDTYCVEEIGKGRIFAGVFDGHGGSAVAELCAKLAPGLHWQFNFATPIFKPTS